MHTYAVAAALSAVLASMPGVHGLYSQNSPVLQLNAKTYNTLVAQSNHTSVVEFYAPWCGHCKNLKPIYEKAARKLDGLAKVAAVDCDDEMNKQFCSVMGVKGFPTLMTVRPGKKPGSKPIVDTYQGPRTAASIAEAVVSKINNHVTRVTDQDLDTFLAGEKPKAILFTEKGSTSALLRSLAIDFLDVVSVGQIRNKELKSAQKFGIEKYPTFVLVPGGDKEPIIYNGELNKKDMVEFLKLVGEPNPDPAPVQAKSKSQVKAEPKTKKDKSFKAYDTDKFEGTDGEAMSAEVPISSSEVTSITTVTSKEALTEKCLHTKAHTCIIAFIPTEASESGVKVTASLTHLNAKYIQGHRQTFTFLAVPSQVEGVDVIQEALGLGAQVELVAVNARRAWWRHYQGDFGIESVELWIDLIRMGEGSKMKLPKDIIHHGAETSSDSAETTTEQSSEPSSQEMPEEEVKHEEL